MCVLHNPIHVALGRLELVDVQDSFVQIPGSARLRLA